MRRGCVRNPHAYSRKILCRVPSPRPYPPTIPKPPYFFFLSALSIVYRVFLLPFTFHCDKPLNTPITASRFALRPFPYLRHPGTIEIDGLVLNKDYLKMRFSHINCVQHSLLFIAKTPLDANRFCTTAGEYGVL